MLCHSLVMLCQSGLDHSCFVIIFNETDQSSDFAISLPCHSRVMKQILLRVATMCAEIICSEIRQHLSSHFASPGKIFFAQDSFDPNVNGECCDSLVGEEHDAISHFHPHARELAQLLPQL